MNSPTADSLAGIRPDRLIDKARSGCDHSLGEVLEICRQYLTLVANEELGGGLRAKVGGSDIVQETLLEAHQDFDTFSGSSEDELLRWLRNILMNNLRDISRSFRQTAKRRLSLETPMGGQSHVILATRESPSEVAMRGETREEIERALASLPSHYRQVITLRNLELKQFSEVGRVMKLSPGAARKLWQRAIDELAGQLEDDNAS